SSDYVLQSILPGPSADLGTVIPGGSDVVVTNQLEAGETGIYRFTVPSGALRVTVGLEEVSGYGAIRLRGDQLPALDLSAYGQDGGYRGTWEHTNIVTVPSPAPGAYTLSVFASNNGASWPPLKYKLRVQAAAPASVLPFDNGNVRITGQSTFWQVYTVVVPT